MGDNDDDDGDDYHVILKMVKLIFVLVNEWISSASPTLTLFKTLSLV